MREGKLAGNVKPKSSLTDLQKVGERKCVKCDEEKREPYKSVEAESGNQRQAR